MIANDKLLPPGNFCLQIMIPKSVTQTVPEKSGINPVFSLLRPASIVIFHYLTNNDVIKRYMTIKAFF